LKVPHHLEYYDATRFGQRDPVNHSTYHCGQVASKLKRLGVEQPATDFVFWAFEQIPQTA
jgi:hypothetical protein